MGSSHPFNNPLMPEDNPNLAKLAKVCPEVAWLEGRIKEAYDILCDESKSAEEICSYVSDYLGDILYGRPEPTIFPTIAARLLELAGLLDKFASGKINSDDWKRVETILDKKFYIKHDGKTLNRKEPA